MTLYPQITSFGYFFFASIIFFISLGLIKGSSPWTFIIKFEFIFFDASATLSVPVRQFFDVKIHLYLLAETTFSIFLLSTVRDSRVHYSYVTTTINGSIPHPWVYKCHLEALIASQHP